MTHPISFSHLDLVRAVLSGEKTMTRCIIRPQPLDWLRPSLDIYPFLAYKPGDYLIEVGTMRRVRLEESRGRIKKYWGELTTVHKPCPYGDVGDVLWLKEPWAMVSGKIIYRADLTEEQANKIVDWRTMTSRIQSRLALYITELRAEPLHYITAQDLKQERLPEGYPPNCPRCGGYGKIGHDHNTCRDCPRCSTEQDKFALWWNLAHPSHLWESNPWVWVLGLKEV